MARFQISGFVDIVQSIVTSGPDQTVEETCRSLGARELSQLWSWNQTVPPTIDRCMHDIIAEKMVQHPEKPAVLSWDGELSYGELDRLSRRLAARLSRMGVSVGKSVVPLCFEKSMWTVVALLAVMRAGGAFVLTDPQQPEARLATICEEVGAQVVLTSAKQAELGSRIAPNAEIVVVGSEQLSQEVETDEPLLQLQPVPAAAILYIIFTSGSTGKPKGVVISHENFTSGALPRAEAVGYKPHSRVLDFPSYAFDVSIDCMLCTLSVGGCICVPSEDQRVNDLSGAIMSMRANMAHMTPSVARLLPLDTLASLEVLGLGGESLSSGDASIWSKTTKLIIAYGPSECTVGCTINNNIHIDRSYTSIGRGVGGVTWIVDPDRPEFLTPVGGIGELWIEGPVVGVGYLNEPEKTAQAFVEDPPWLLAGAEAAQGRHGRLYKTGDLVKYDPDGSGDIIFVGRKDRQVKLRGQRVELAEIEHHILKKLPEGASVAVEVITPGGKDRDPSLVTFITEQKEKQPPVNGAVMSFSSDLRSCLKDIDSYVADKLPIYMVPTAYIPLPVMPLLVSCKVDRKRLHEIGLAMTPQQLAKFRVEVTQNREPTTETERKLQQIWKQLVGEGIDIGTNDNFFALGGDSLKAMKLVAAARAQGFSLTVAQIFANPTLAAMASTAGRVTDDVEAETPPFSLLGPDWSEEDARAQVAALCKLPPSVIEDVYRCTPLQEGLMALSAKISDSYIAQRVVDLADLPTAHMLKAAFEQVSDSCPILRTRIVQVPGRGLMQVVVNGKLPWASNGGSLEEYLQEDRARSMGLGDALARFAIVTTGDDNAEKGKVHMVLTIHHALYDGWSMPLIIHRVNQAYRGLLTAERPTPFNHFIKYLYHTDRPSSEGFWKDRLQGATGQQFPVLPFPGYQPQANSLLEHYVQLSGGSVRSNTTVANAIRAAWALTAARYTSCNDPVFGETLTGRNAPVAGIGEIEGPLITTVPICVRVDWSMRARDFLKMVQDEVVLRIPHEHMGLQNIRRLSADAREACELRTGMVLHPTTEENLMVEDDKAVRPADGFVPVDDVEAAREALKFNSYALMLVCSLDPAGFLTMASFDSKTVDTPQMQAVLSDFGRTVQELCENGDRILSDLELVKPPSRENQALLSSLGVRSITESSGKEDLRQIADHVKATWIVDPSNSDHLLPAGAVGEILIESPAELPRPLLPLEHAPRWLLEDQNQTDNPKVEARFYTTGQLAKYNSDGSLVLLGRKDEKATPRNAAAAEAAAHTNGLRDKHQTSMTAVEQQLRRLWSRILNVPEDEIGSESSFFVLGGDSIGVMKLVSEARLLEGLEVTVAEIFQHRRLREMADVVRPVATTPKPDLAGKAVVAENTPFSALDLDGIDPDGNVDAFISRAIRPALADASWKILDVLPARPMQEIAVRGTVQLPRYSARYELVYMDGEAVNRDRLFKSCEDLVRNNEILRTVFVHHDERCYAVVLEDLEVPVVEYEIDGASDGGDLQGFVYGLCELDIQTKMPLGAPFVKFFWVRQCPGPGQNQTQSNGQGERDDLDGERSCLVLRISHAQYDEICLPHLLHQLSGFYEGRAVPTTVPFSSFVYHVLRDNIPRSIEYWRTLLRGSSGMTVLRPDGSSSDMPVSRKSTAIARTFDISRRDREVTVATLPTAAWALCLARRVGLRDVVFGEVVSGRKIDFPSSSEPRGDTGDMEMDMVMGPTWQYVPVRIQFAPGWTGIELLSAIQQQHVTSSAFEGIGLREIVENCTDWPSKAQDKEKVEWWFDSVVHQDVEHVTNLSFSSANATMETVYPHEEPLREWKIQAFLSSERDSLTLEIVTFESWKGFAEELLEDLGACLELLVNMPREALF